MARIPTIPAGNGDSMNPHVMSDYFVLFVAAVVFTALLFCTRHILNKEPGPPYIVPVDTIRVYRVEGAPCHE